jgi:hypothetical protein
MDEGWRVAITSGASEETTSSPRCAVTRNARPSSACAAVAPRHTSARGRTTAISAASQGWQACASPGLGFWWIGFLPRGSHLKCFTALVT